MNFDKNEKFGLTITLSVNIVMLLFFLFYTLDNSKNLRPSYIEVEFGEFKTGTLAQFSEVRNEEVAKRPNPSEVTPDKPKEEIPEPEETPTKPVQEEVKPVDLPDEIEKVIEEKITTPVTEKINPEKVNEEKPKEEVETPPVAVKDLEISEGETESGSVDGLTGKLDAESGAGTDDDKSAPFDLKWEGDLDRSLMVQPLPSNNTNTDGVISVRFEVRPDGTVGRIIPLRKMNPELEQEVQRTLRNWKFSRLPAGAPQQAQWGTITFRFVFN